MYKDMTGTFLKPLVLCIVSCSAVPVSGTVRSSQRMANVKPHLPFFLHRSRTNILNECYFSHKPDDDCTISKCSTFPSQIPICYPKYSTMYPCTCMGGTWDQKLKPVVTVRISLLYAVIAQYLGYYSSGICLHVTVSEDCMMLKLNSPCCVQWTLTAVWEVMRPSEELSLTLNNNKITGGNYNIT